MPPELGRRDGYTGRRTGITLLVTKLLVTHSFGICIVPCANFCLTETVNWPSCEQVYTPGTNVG